jgi:hypothetical protein
MSSSTLAAELCRAIDVPVFGDDDAPRKAANRWLLEWKKANATAFAHLYGKKRPKVSPIQPARHTLTPVALLKALHCVRYNCDVPAATLDNVIKALEEHVVTSLPEYEQAHWFL